MCVLESGELTITFVQPLLDWGNVYMNQQRLLAWNGREIQNALQIPYTIIFTRIAFVKFKLLVQFEFQAFVMILKNFAAKIINPRLLAEYSLKCKRSGN